MHDRAMTIYEKSGLLFADGILTDITDRKEAEEKLRKSEEKYRQLVENLNVGVFSSALDGVFQHVNPALLKIARNCGIDDFSGVQTHQLYADISDRPKLLGELRDRGFVRDREIRYLSKNGTVHYISMSAVLQRDEAGKPDRITGIIEDITERKRYEDALIQAQKYRAVVDLAAGVAHNFNNLLQIVLGNADIALMDIESGDYTDVKHNLEIILKSSKLGAETVERLQRYVHHRQHGEASDTRVFDLSDAVAEAIELKGPWLLTEPEKDMRRISLDHNLKSGATIRGNRTEIVEVIINLITNSAEAIRTTGSIRVETELKGDQVLLRVQDTGIGIPQDKLHRLFTPFFTTNTAIGRGMGLAVCMKIVEDHGGSINVESVEGAGTTVTLTLPFVEEPLVEIKVLQPTVTHRALNILVVDDVESIVDLLRASLERFGHTVLTSLSGEEALEVYGTHPIDMIICDFGMPVMNGIQVAAEVRRIAKERRDPRPWFIILTGWDDQYPEISNAAALGLDAVLHKPMSVTELSRVVEQVSSRVRE